MHAQLQTPIGRRVKSLFGEHEQRALRLELHNVRLHEPLDVVDGKPARPSLCRIAHLFNQRQIGPATETGDSYHLGFEIVLLVEEHHLGGEVLHAGQHGERQATPGLARQFGRNLNHRTTSARLSRSVFGRVRLGRVILTPAI